MYWYPSLHILFLLTLIAGLVLKANSSNISAISLETNFRTLKSHTPPKNTVILLVSYIEISDSTFSVAKRDFSLNFIHTDIHVYACENKQLMQFSAHMSLVLGS